MYNYLYLEPFSYINSKNGSVLLINTLSGEKKILKSSNIINVVLKKLNSCKTNIMEIKNEYLKDKQFLIFIKSSKEIMCGDIINSQNIISPPYICKNNIILEEDRLVFHSFNKINETRIEYLGEYLQEVTIFLSANCKFNCHYCDYAYKQYLFCHKFNKLNTLNIKDYERIFTQFKSTGIKIINIIGGNLFNFSELYKLIEIINKLRLTLCVRLIIHSNHILNQKPLPSYFSQKNLELVILLDEELSIDQTKLILENTHQMRDNILYALIITSNNSYRLFNKVFKMFDKNRFLFVPIYNGNNFEFFRNYVFIDQDDLIENNCSMKQLQLNQIINTNYFGKLFLLPDGIIKTNMNSQNIGNVLNNKIKDSLFKELMSNNNWKMVRKNVAKCGSCFFQDLCPPISNYEFALNRNNLCNIK